MCARLRLRHEDCAHLFTQDTWWQRPTFKTLTDGIHDRDQGGNKSAEGLSQAVKILKFKYVVKAIDHYQMDQV